VRSPKGKTHKDWHHYRKSVATPLFDGLLTFLGAAGIAYFTSSKKKNGLDIYQLKPSKSGVFLYLF
jgi:hypothetical protein